MLPLKELANPINNLRIQLTFKNQSCQQAVNFNYIVKELGQCLSS